MSTTAMQSPLTLSRLGTNGRISSQAREGQSSLFYLSSHSHESHSQREFRWFLVLTISLGRCGMRER